jgi:hypothetical protein
MKVRLRRAAAISAIGAAVMLGSVAHAPMASAKEKQVLCGDSYCDVFEKSGDAGGGWSTWNWTWRIWFGNDLHWV